MNKILLLSLFLLCAITSMAQPTNNPVTDYYKTDYGTWTRDIKWSNVVDASTITGLWTDVSDYFNTDPRFPDAEGNCYLVDSTKLQEALKTLSQSGGGVLYFQSGKYIFPFDIRLVSNVVIRGEDLIASALDASFSPGTIFIFPKYLYDDSGATNPSNRTAFKKIYTPKHCSNTGLVSLTINRAAVYFRPLWSNTIPASTTYYPEFDDITTTGQGFTQSETYTLPYAAKNYAYPQPITIIKNIVLFNLRICNAAEANGSVPVLGKQPAYHRYANQRNGVIDGFCIENCLVANCRINDVQNYTTSGYSNSTYQISSDNFTMTGYKYDDGTTLGSVNFDYLMHYGIVINRLKLFTQRNNITEWGSAKWYHNMLEEPGAFGRNIEVIGNWVVKSGFNGLKIGGFGALVRKNKILDLPEKNTSIQYLNSIGTKKITLSQNLSNQGIEISGWKCLVDSNDVEVIRHKLLDAPPTYTTDGEGITHEESGAFVCDVEVNANITKNSITFQKTKDIFGLKISNNNMLGAEIRINSDVNTTKYGLFDVSVSGNIVASGQRISILGSKIGYATYCVDNDATSGIDLSCYVKSNNNLGAVSYYEVENFVAGSPCVINPGKHIARFTNPSKDTIQWSLTGEVEEGIELILNVHYPNGTNPNIAKVDLFLNGSMFQNDLVPDAQGNVKYFWTAPKKYSKYIFTARVKDNIDTVWVNRMIDVKEGTSGFCGTPIFNPIPGTYIGDVTVSVTTKTSGAKLYYTTDGSDPDTLISSILTDGLLITATTDLKVMAAKWGKLNSEIKVGVFEILPKGIAADPVFSPASSTQIESFNLTITSTTPGATIFYTTDGTDPNVNSPQYKTPIVIDNIQTVKARAWKNGLFQSNIIRADYVVKCATPVYNPSPGTYDFSPNLFITGTTPNGTIYYTIDGSTPSKSSNMFVTGFNVLVSGTLKSIVVRDGRETSDVLVGEYVVTPRAPRYSPTAGKKAAAVSVTLSSLTSGVTIYYTTNGDEPTISSTLWSGTPIDVSTNMTIRAISVKDVVISPPSMAQYIIGSGTPVDNPKFSPVAGTYSTAKSIFIYTNLQSTSIYYTTDGSVPTTASTLFVTPFIITANTFIKAVAVRSGYLNSNMSIANFNIACMQPSFSVIPGSYQNTQVVSLSTLTPGATIYYTTDGSNPTTSSTVYTIPLNVNSSTTIKAIAGKTNFTVSSTSIGDYIISVATPNITPTQSTHSVAINSVLTCSTTGAEIRYTLDGTLPTAASTLYTTPINITSNTIVRAIAFKAGISQSLELIKEYLIQCPAPQITPNSGNYTAQQTVTLTTSLSGAEIYYVKTSPNEPALPPIKYTAPFVVDRNTVVSAIVTKNGYANSPVTEVTINVTRYNLTVNKIGNGTINLVSGKYSGIKNIVATPDASWRFDKWAISNTGIVTNASTNINITSDVTATAYFVKTCLLSVNILNGGGTGNVNIASLTTQDLNSTITILATPGANSKVYKWYLNGVEAQIDGNTYQPTLTNPSNLVSVVFEAGIGNNEQFNSNSVYKLYPNPVQNVLQISNTENVNSIEILDAAGRILDFKNNDGSAMMLIQVNQLSSGFYFVKLKTKTGEASTLKFEK